MPSQITSTELCNLVTPADFPVHGQPSPGYPKREDKPDESDCGYQLRIGSDVAARFTAGLSLFPGGRLEPRNFEGRQEISVAGKRAALGQGKIKGEPGECDLFFETSKGRWMITVVDQSAPNKDGCVAAQSIGEKVAARVP
jgi:hypothetical protein